MIAEPSGEVWSCVQSDPANVNPRENLFPDAKIFLIGNRVIYGQFRGENMPLFIFQMIWDLQPQVKYNIGSSGGNELCLWQFFFFFFFRGIYCCHSLTESNYDRYKAFTSISTCSISNTIYLELWLKPVSLNSNDTMSIFLIPKHPFGVWIYLPQMVECSRNLRQILTWSMIFSMAIFLDLLLMKE